MNKDFSQSFMQSIEGKNATVVGKFSCPGHNNGGAKIQRLIRGYGEKLLREMARWLT